MTFAELAEICPQFDAPGYEPLSRPLTPGELYGSEPVRVGPNRSAQGG
ncbi:MAG: hypothetical protein WEA09_04950 [Gemmatimonadota bacterium]